jgi:hypothetical protein
MLKERAIYYDTDSFIYIQEGGHPLYITCGGRLGDMTNDLDPDNYIEEFKYGAKVLRVQDRECGENGKINLNFPLLS